MSKLTVERQLQFQALLAAARNVWLHDALLEAVKKVDHKVLKSELGTLIPGDVQKILASAGIRDEQVFPAPCLIREAPQLIGYYRLLLGSPQKTFYAPGTGMSVFKSAEAKGLFGKRQEAAIGDFCLTMADLFSQLVREISPAITHRDVLELPILTLGSMFQGSNNNKIGQQATLNIFLAVADIMGDFVKARTEHAVTIVNSSGREVKIVYAGDPDICIVEIVGQKTLKKVAIEIKGGMDKANAHNRAGEAEKSHQKARHSGFPQCWTIISKKGVDFELLMSGSHSTNIWFDVSQVLARSGEDWVTFVHELCAQVGIPVPKSFDQST